MKNFLEKVKDFFSKAWYVFLFPVVLFLIRIFTSSSKEEKEIKETIRDTSKEIKQDLKELPKQEEKVQDQESEIEEQVEEIKEILEDSSEKTPKDDKIFEILPGLKK